MLPFLLRMLIARRERLVLVIVSTMLIAVAFSLFASASAATVVTADKALNQYWRTTYDILVRAPSAVTDIEQTYGLIEANHLSGTPGGITLQQWEAIKAIPNVEVAAPIAMVGYVAKPAPTINLVGGIVSEAGMYRVSSSTSIDNGYRSLMSELVPYKALYFGKTNFDFLERNEFRQNNEQGYSNLGIYPFSGFGDAEFTFYQPTFYDWMLIAAIDPTEEAKLVYLDQQISNGRYLYQEEPIYDEAGYGYLPLLLNQQDYISTTDTIRLEKLLVPFTTTSPYENIPLPSDVEAAGGRAFLDTIPTELTWETTFSGRNGIRDVFAPVIEILPNQSEPRRVQVPYSGFRTEVRLPAPVSYREVTTPPSFLADYDLVLEAVPVGTTSGEQEFTGVFAMVQDWTLEREVTYRALEPSSANDLKMIPAVVGAFDVDNLSALGGASPNQVPLETYFPPRVTLKFDEAGNSISPPAELRPTLNDEGYLVTPPEALTTLNNAYQLMSNAEMIEPDDGFISAIRVRVGGITDLTPEAQARIETVAQRVVEDTGLHVDIMVGSSPQRVMVHIPGYEGVPALGYVEEGWVKKGVATEVTRGLNRADALLLGTMGISCLLYLFNAAFIGVLGRLPEFGMMRALGWRRATLFSLVTGEAVLLGVLSGVLGALVALLIVAVFRLPVPWQQVLLLIPISGAAFAVGSILPAWQATRVPPSIVIRGGETTTTTTPLPAGASLWGYALGSVVRRPARTFATIAGLALSGGLLVVLYLVLVGLGGQLYGTLLGTWVRTALAPYHFAMGAVALLASGLAVAEVMTLNVTQRRREVGLLRALGWRQGALARTFLLESAIVGVVGGLIGTGLAIGLYYSLQGTLPADPLVWLVVPGLGVGVPLLTALVATLYPAIRAARMLPLDALRGEERLAPGGTLTQTVTWLGLGATVVGIGIVAATWYVEGIPDPAAVAVVVTPSVTPTATLAAAPPPQATPTLVAPDTFPRYTLSLRATINDNPLSGQITGREIITYTNTTGTTLKDIALRLYPNTPFRAAAGVEQIERLRVDEAKVNGATVVPSLVATDTVALLPLAEPLAPGAVAQVEIGFTYDLPENGQRFDNAWLLHTYAPLLAAFEEGAWQTESCLVCNTTLISGSAGRFALQIALPNDWTAIAAGVAQNTTSTSDGTTTYTYTADNTRMLPIALIRNWNVQEATAGDTRVLLYTPPDAPVNDALLPLVAQILAQYEARFGQYPYPTLRIVAGPREATSALAYPGMMYLRYPAEGEVSAQVVAKEIAGEWWGGSVGTDFYKEPWLAISLANYAAYQFVESADPASAQTIIAGWEQQERRLEIVEDAALPVGTSTRDFPTDGAAFNETMNVRGTLFLHTLRQQIGDDAFFAGWRTYADQYLFGVGSGDGFREAMEQASGKSLVPLFAEWGVLGETP